MSRLLIPFILYEKYRQKNVQHKFHGTNNDTYKANWTTKWNQNSWNNNNNNNNEQTEWVNVYDENEKSNNKKWKNDDDDD